MFQDRNDRKPYIMWGSKYNAQYSLMSLTKQEILETVGDHVLTSQMQIRKLHTALEYLATFRMPILLPNTRHTEIST